MVIIAINFALAISRGILSIVSQENLFEFFALQISMHMKRRVSPGRIVAT